MGLIKGKPQVVKTIALMQVWEEGSINAEDILVSTKGELCINLDAPLGEKMVEDDQYNSRIIDEDEEEDEEIMPIEDEYIYEEFSIKRISKEEDWYEINIDGKLIKSVCEKTFNTTKDNGNYIVLWTIPNFQKLLQKILTTNPGKNTRTLETFSQLTKKEKHNLKKGNLEVLLTQAQQNENFEIAIEIRDILNWKT